MNMEFGNLTKAFQQMGFEKATGKRENETMAWQKKRTYLFERTL